MSCGLSPLASRKASFLDSGESRTLGSRRKVTADWTLALLLLLDILMLLLLQGRQEAG
jgi:hypothetical protein